MSRVSYAKDEHFSVSEDRPYSETYFLFVQRFPRAPLPSIFIRPRRGGCGRTFLYPARSLVDKREGREGRWTP